MRGPAVAMREMLSRPSVTSTVKTKSPDAHTLCSCRCRSDQVQRKSPSSKSFAEFDPPRPRIAAFMRGSRFPLTPLGRMDMRARPICATASVNNLIIPRRVLRGRANFAPQAWEKRRLGVRRYSRLIADDFAWHARRVSHNRYQMPRVHCGSRPADRVDARRPALPERTRHHDSQPQIARIRKADCDNKCATGPYEKPEATQAMFDAIQRLKNASSSRRCSHAASTR